MKFIQSLFGKKENEQSCCSIKFEEIKEVKSDCCEIKIEEVQENDRSCCK